MKQFQATIIFLSLILGLIAPMAPAKAFIPTFSIEGIGHFVWDNVVLALASIALEQIKQLIINKMIQDTVTWVQGGGKPRFVTDWKGFTKDAQKKGIANFKAQAKNFAATCFNTQIKIDFDLAFNNLGLKDLDCSIFGIKNPNFYNDFKIGGFKAYLQGSLPSGNFYGASDEARKQGIAAKIKAGENAEKETSDGFTPNKICTTASDGQTTCRVNTPGNVVSASLNSIISAPIDFISGINTDSPKIGATLGKLGNAMLNIAFSRLLQNKLFK